MPGQRTFYSSNEDINDVSTINPLSYVDWLKYENVFDKNTAFELYTVYLNNWYATNTDSTTEQQQQYVRNQYIQLIKQITLEYTTPEEKRFLANIDYNNNKDLDIALPFYSKKIKQIAIYYAGQREEVKYSKIKNNLKGSDYGLSQVVYKQLADIVANDTQIIQQLQDLSLTINDVLLNLDISVEELYDTEQNYYNISEKSSKQEYTSFNNSPRFNYFDTSILPTSTRLFLQETYTQAVIDLIKEIPVMLLSTSGDESDYTNERLITSTNESFAISETVTGTELDRLDSSAFTEYMKTGELNITYEQLAFQKYSGTDYFYLSTGDTLSETTTGQLFTASAAHKNILNRHHPTIASVVGENLYKLEYLGGFFLGTGVGLASFASFDYNYKYIPEVNTIKYFPDPEVGATGYFGAYEKYSAPVRYYENINWNKQSVVMGYNYGLQSQLEDVPRFTPYQSKEQSYNEPTGTFRHNDVYDFWDDQGKNIWTSPDIYGTQQSQADIDERQQDLLTGKKIVYRWKTDIYGNNYSLVKDNVDVDKTAPVNSASNITQSEYITNSNTNRSDNISKYGWQTKIEGTSHSRQNLAEQKNSIGTLYARNNTFTGLHRIDDPILTDIYKKYNIIGTVEYKQKTITITDIGNEIINKLIDFDIIQDIMILETRSYIIIEKISYDYDTGRIYSGNKNYTFIVKQYYDNKFSMTGNWWYDESKQRILLCQTTEHPLQSGTNDKMIYIILYNFDMTTLKLRQAYPDPDYSESQLIYETSQFSLSSIPGDYNIVKCKPPVLTFNKDSERYSVSQLQFDVSRNPYYLKTDFRMYMESIELIRTNFFKNNYFTYALNGYNETIPDYFNETNPSIVSTTWYHDTYNNVMYMGANETAGEPTAIANSSSVWTYGIESDSYETERDIVMTFEFCMFGTTAPNGLSVLFYNSRNAANTGYETVTAGGLGPAFNYLPDDTTGSGTVNSPLTGVHHGHACIALDVLGTFGNGSLTSGVTLQPNSVVVTGPYETAISKQNVDVLPVQFQLHDSTLTPSTMKFTTCRVTLTDLGRRVLVDMMNSEEDDRFTRVSDTQISDLYPTGPTGPTTTTSTTTTTGPGGGNPVSRPYYKVPARLNVSLAFNNSDPGGICAIRNINITGSSPTRSGLTVTV